MKSVALYALLAWCVSNTELPDELELELLRRRITAYRTIAEWLGHRVIILEGQHSSVAAKNRMV